MSNTVSLRELGVTLKVNLPDYSGNTTEREATWMRNVIGSVYEVAFGVTIWLVSIRDSIVTPLCCAMYFTEEESKRIKLGEMLNMNIREVMEQIYERRINDYYTEYK